jgi:elongation factor Ts
MAITAEMVKTLREKSGAGMMECKAALTEAGGDMERAIDILRARGLAQAAKKAGRATGEGLIGSYVTADRRTGALVEVNCESDFVARTDDFQRLIRDIAEDIASAGAVSEQWLKDPGGPVQPRVAAAIAKLGENIGVGRFVRLTGHGVVGLYIHLGGKLGVLVEFAGVSPQVTGDETFQTLLKEIAMQVAAANPQYVRREDVPAEVIEREKGIFRAQLEGQKKPANVLEKIIEGKLGAFYQQVVLPDQPSIREPKMTVSQVIATAAKAVGAELKVTRFARLKVGEAAA